MSSIFLPNNAPEWSCLFRDAKDGQNNARHNDIMMKLEPGDRCLQERDDYRYIITPCLATDGKPYIQFVQSH